MKPYHFSSAQRKKWAEKNNLKKTCKNCGHLYENKKYAETDMCDDCCDAVDLETERGIEDSRLARNY